MMYKNTNSNGKYLHVGNAQTNIHSCQTLTKVNTNQNEGNERGRGHTIFGFQNQLPTANCLKHHICYATKKKLKR